MCCKRRKAIVCRLILSLSSRIWVATPEVDVGRGEIVQALVIAPMIIMVDEAGDVSFEIAGQVIVFEQNTVLERLVPALDLALGLGMMRCAADVSHAAICEPFREIAREVA